VRINHECVVAVVKNLMVTGPGLRVSRGGQGWERMVYVRGCTCGVSDQRVLLWISLSLLRRKSGLIAVLPR
jgi:hypothetical protein